MIYFFELYYQKNESVYYFNYNKGDTNCKQYKQDKQCTYSLLH